MSYLITDFILVLAVADLGEVVGDGGAEDAAADNDGVGGAADIAGRGAGTMHFDLTKQERL